MWSYYGSKKSIIDYYPPPKYGKIIEPFAGAASYAVKYWDREVLLVDKYEVITKIWKWLQLCSKNDLLQLPRTMDPNDSLDNYMFDCEEAKLLMGFVIAKGVERPRVKPTSRATISRPNTINFTLNKIANNLHKIKHWKIIHGSYEDLPNEEATYFVDPPYEWGGGCLC